MLFISVQMKHVRGELIRVHLTSLGIFVQLADGSFNEQRMTLRMFLREADNLKKCQKFLFFSLSNEVKLT